MLKTEKSSNIKTLHRFIFGNDGDMKNRENQRIKNFTDFPFKTDSDVYEETIRRTKDDFSVNGLITICDVLCIDNSGYFDKIATRIISCLCDLNVLNLNIVHKKDSDTNNEILNETTAKNSSTKINAVPSISDNIARNDFSSTKKEMARLLVPDAMEELSINFSDIKNMIAPFEGNLFQNIEK